jgi:hypothetical protein
MKLTATNSVAASIAGIGLAALLVGCTSAGSTAGSSAPATSSATSGGAVASVSPAGGSSAGATPTGGATPSESGPSGSASSPAAQGGTGGLAILPCPTSGLKVATGTAGAAAGSLYQQIDFTNTSGRTCTLYGYPGVAQTTDMTPGSQVGAAATKSTAKPKMVITLAAGKTASATLQITQVVNYPTANCGPEDSRYLQVYPPGQTAAVYLPYQSKGCTKPVFVLGITAIVAGA